MNRVDLVGRITADPEVKFSASGKAYVRFSLAVNRESKDKGVDYPNCTAFGKTAELIGEWVKKGKLLAITGRIQTGSYEKDGRKIYTTDVMVERVEFLERRDDDDYVIPPVKTEEHQQTIPEGFSHLDDDIPF